MDVPVHGVAAPAAVISIKSTLDSDTAAAVTVRARPMVSVLTKTRLMALLPVMVKVPVMEKEALLGLFPENESASVLVAVPVLVKLANVRVWLLAVRTVAVPLPVKFNVPKESVLPWLKLALIPVRLIVELAALKVRLAAFVVFQDGVAELMVMFDEPSVKVRVLLLLELKLPQCCVCPFVFSVPVVKITSPTTVKPELSRSVRSDLLMVNLLAEAGMSIVTVALVPEPLSNVTWSPSPGGPEPPLPPEIVDQCVVSLQFPDPPIQNNGLDALGLGLGLLLELGETEAEGEREAEVEDEGEREAETEDEGLTPKAGPGYEVSLALISSIQNVVAIRFGL